MSTMGGMRRRALLLSLIKRMNEEGSWCGETHVQKCVYFLQSMLDVPIGFDFILYKHGPFSFDLRDELTAMRADELIELELQPSYGPSFRLGPLGQDLISFYPRTVARYESPVQFLAGKVSKRGVSELERLGTALYVTKDMNPESPPGPISTRAQRMHSLKPHISLQQATDALTDVDQLIRDSKEFTV